jgi:hypothetical protein
MVSAQYLDADSMSEVISGIVSGAEIDIEDDYEIKSKYFARQAIDLGLGQVWPLVIPSILCQGGVAIKDDKNRFKQCPADHSVGI